MIIDQDIPEIPDPVHNPKAHQSSAFMTVNSDFSEEDISFYKDLMAMLVTREPGLHPDLLAQEHHLTDDFPNLSEAEQRKQYRAWAGKIVNLLKPIFSDEKYMVNLCEELACTFMDIMHCLYSYYGALLYKQPQFSRWLTVTLTKYSDETKRALNLPRS